MTVTKTPWGEYRTLLHYGALEGKSVKVKELVLRPGETTSYQYHLNRSEILIPLSNGLDVCFEDVVWSQPPFKPIIFYANEKHQLINCSDRNLVILEVQFGSETEESDIVRIDDPHKDVRKDYTNA